MGELIDLQKYREELLTAEIQDLKRQLLEICQTFNCEDELLQNYGYYNNVGDNGYFMLLYPLSSLPYFY